MIRKANRLIGDDMTSDELAIFDKTTQNEELFF